MSALRVQIERIKEDLLALASIGRNEDDRGNYRMAFTDHDMAGKRWLQQRIEDAGLQASMDGAANVSGVLDGKDGGPRIFVGSHIDTVPCAGMLDGALGVVVGLECLRVLKESGTNLQRAIELIAFSDEEGRFGGTFGSESFTGLVNVERIESSVDLNGVRLFDAMQAHGLDPLKALDARRPAEEILAYLELHIEQGPVLDEQRLQVGIVDNITGLRSWSLKFAGEANHAGTTPMDYRKDAFMGLADFAHEIPRILEENGGEHSRATIGKAEILPGAPNSVPGNVEFSLDFRDPSPEKLDELSLAFQRALAAISRRRKLMFEFSVQGEIHPVDCDLNLVKILQFAADDLDLRSLNMLSGAAHDAQVVGRIAPMGMVFVPSQGGVSHSPAEWTAWEDVEAGANVMLQALQHLGTQPS
ncbi:Zn-dependent hydrolase [Verrucomicrobiaceae bacterium 5K15]|uniref:Zn-dependent hydrolase n=1 Tax=Oceaniferula flava TaxID=2800421 RepID=A0AAE2SBR2_9BACT|nr:Zn-dependent hydrolase [Oceaniferula flavus]MBK1854948.1 Zn-dependent hydrolase [Oceaniferula flavus]MBM1136254.1 Zn-dependent hydrolase [Oceaniferula flavus]